MFQGNDIDMTLSFPDDGMQLVEDLLINTKKKRESNDIKFEIVYLSWKNLVTMTPLINSYIICFA